ncbi:MAG: Biopolymer transport protein ExbD [Chlamydiae bacterium]|nr:Biopolymer transport protein ExbD [Chlamydiota bacterium]
MRRRRAIALENSPPEINLTPLIDVVFVILILFIVIAPLLDKEEIDLAPVSTLKSSSVQESSSLTLHVYADERITLNKQPVALKELSTYLEAAYKRNPELTPQLFHDKNARFGTYQEIKTKLEKAGFSKLDVILAPS